MTLWRVACGYVVQDRPGTVFLDIAGIVDGDVVEVTAGAQLLHLYMAHPLVGRVLVDEDSTLGLSGGTTLNATDIVLHHGAVVQVGSVHDDAETAIGFDTLTVAGGSTTDDAQARASCCWVRPNASAAPLSTSGIACIILAELRG